MTTNYHHTEYISVCVYSSGSQYLTPEMYIITFHWKFLVICTFDLRVPFLLSKHLLFQSIKKVAPTQMELGSAKQRERKYSSSSITIENQLDTWLAMVGYEKTWCSLAHSLQEVVLHTSIFKHKNWNMTHYSKKAQCARNMILFMHLSCAQQVRIWIWKWSNHYWICIYRLFMHKLNPTCTCNHESNLHMWNTSILVTIDFFPFW